MREVSRKELTGVRRRPYLVRLTLAMSRAPERQHHGHEVRRLHRMLGGTVATLTLRNGSPGGREHENCCARIARVCH